MNNLMYFCPWFRARHGLSIFNLNMPFFILLDCLTFFSMGAFSCIFFHIFACALRSMWYKFWPKLAGVLCFCFLFKILQYLIAISAHHSSGAPDLELIIATWLTTKRFEICRMQYFFSFFLFVSFKLTLIFNVIY